MIQDVCPTTDRVGQHHQRREAPAGRNRRGIGGQIGTVDQRAVWGGMSLRAQNRTGIQAQHQARPDQALRQQLSKHANQGRTINLTILQRFVQARPAAPKAGRLRQLDQRAGVTVSQQGIRQIEQGIGCAGEAFMRQIVPIHLQNGILHRGTSYGLSTQKIPCWAI